MTEATVPCPQCNAPVTFTLGHIARCEGCGSEVRVNMEVVDVPASSAAIPTPSNPVQIPQPQLRQGRLLILGLCAGLFALVMLGRGYKAEQDREETKKLKDQKPDAAHESLVGKLGQVKEGMTVDEAERIMGIGKMGLMGREECLAWDYKSESQPVTVYVKVKNGKVAEVSTNYREGEGLRFRPKPKQ